MSADAWQVCPRCKKERIKEPNPYGKVSEKEYLKLVAQGHKAAVHAGDEEYEYTLREDYEIWTGIDGTFSVRYTCCCTNCGFSYKFEHTKQLSLEDKGGE